MDRTRSGRETSRTYVRMKAGCIWQWSLTCGHVPLLAGPCRHWPAMPCGWRKRSRNVIVYTDRGRQYCSADYQALLKRHNLRGSMRAKGCCYDNTCVESFFHSLKVECIHGEHFISRETMRATAFNYIECYYNRWRRHNLCGCLSPEQFENQKLA